MITRNAIRRLLHENLGYWQGRSGAAKGRKADASDDAFFYGYRLGLTGGPSLNKFTIPEDHPELKEPS